jgi:hypothetical protein
MYEAMIALCLMLAVYLAYRLAKHMGNRDGKIIERSSEEEIGSLPPIDAGDITGYPGETFYWRVNNVNYFVEVNQPTHVRGRAGMSVRVAPVISIRGGGSRSHYENRMVTASDVGTLLFSDVRVLFIGRSGVARFGYERIMAVTALADGLTIAVDGGPPVTFRTRSQREAIVLRRLIDMHAQKLNEERKEETPVHDSGRDLRIKTLREMFLAGRLSAESYEKMLSEVDLTDGERFEKMRDGIARRRLLLAEIHRLGGSTEAQHAAKLAALDAEDHDIDMLQQSATGSISRGTE